MNPGAMIPTDLQTGVEYTAWTGYGSPDNVTVLGTISTDTDASSVASSAVSSSASSSLTVKKGAYSDFQKIHLAPILKTGVVVYGEVNKWVPVSVWRMAGVTMAADGTTALKQRGMAGENRPLPRARWGHRVSSRWSSAGRSRSSSSRTHASKRLLRCEGNV